ncbi:MAG: hypothetical protein KDA89_20120 [Planctomycetaceae bacterium]|nr:hypothetical protein [Planctomycetaceae bacterium]
MTRWSNSHEFGYKDSSALGSRIPPEPARGDSVVMIRRTVSNLSVAEDSGYWFAFAARSSDAASLMPIAEMMSRENP